LQTTTKRFAFGLAASTSFLLGVIFNLFRIGFEPGYWLETFRILGVIASVSLAPVFIAYRKKSYGEIFSFTILSILLHTLLGLADAWLGIGMGYLVLASGIGLSLWGLTKVELRKDFPAILFSLPLSLLFADLFWSRGIHTPFVLEKVFAGQTYADTFFHASIANMIQTHGVVSEGTDGLLTFNYHAFSHFLFVGISELSSTGTFLFYNLGYPMLATFFFISSFYWLSSRVHPQGSAQQNTWFALAVLPVAVIIQNTPGYIPSLKLFGSESFFVSVIFALLATGCLIELQEKKWHWKVLAAMLLLNILVFAKISTGILFLGGIGYYALFTKNVEKPILTLSLLGASIVPLVLWMLSDQVPFDGPTYFSTLRSPAAYYFLNHVWIFIYAFAWKMNHRHTSLVDLVRQRRSIVLETLLVMAVVGEMPNIFLVTHGFSSTYFSALTRWLALPFLMAEIDKLANQEGKRFRKLLPASFVLATLWTGHGFALHAKRLLKNNWSERRAMTIEQPSIDSLDDLLPALDYLLRPSLQERLRPNKQWVDALVRISSLDRQSKRTTCVYIPQEEPFWEMQQYRMVGTFFMIQSFSELCALNPLVASSGDYYTANYTSRRQAQKLNDLSLAEQAKALGFEQIAYLRSQGDSLRLDYIDVDEPSQISILPR